MAISSKPTDQRGVYAIRDVRVIDGDALDVVIVLPFDALINKRVRLKGWWADELEGPWAEAGHRAKARLEEFCKGKPLWIAAGSERCDKYGRVLADLVDGTKFVDPRAVLGDCQLTEREHKYRRDIVAKQAAAARKKCQGPLLRYDCGPGDPCPDCGSQGERNSGCPTCCPKPPYYF